MLVLSLSAGKKFINAFTALFLPRGRKKGEGSLEQNTAHTAIISSQRVSLTEEKHQNWSPVLASDWLKRNQPELTSFI